MNLSVKIGIINEHWTGSFDDETRTFYYRYSNSSDDMKTLIYVIERP